MKLAIVAGGRGTRLGFKDIPKPMVPLAGKPLLQYQVELALRYGITEIYILSGFMAGAIVDYFGDGSAFGAKITHVVEDEPKGTAGAVGLLKDVIDERFMVFYGDTVMDVDLARMIEFDRAHEGADATILVHPNDHPKDSDLLEADELGNVTAMHPKPHEPGRYYRNLVNAALYVLSPEVFKYIPADRPTDFGRDVFQLMLDAGRRIAAYRTPEYIKDMGTPERLRHTEADIISGKVGRLNLANRRRAIFLDRDGVINRDVDNLRRVRDFELLPDAAPSIRKINESEYLAVVATNQPVIAKGFCSVAELELIHSRMETELGAGGAYLDAIYYCPHHPERGFAGEVPELKIDCECRKPKPGMLLRAAREMNIDLGGSYMVGDTARDVGAAATAGVKSVFVGETASPASGVADYRCGTLAEAVDLILEGEKA